MKKTASFRIVMLIVLAFLLLTAAGCANKEAEANASEGTVEKPIVAVTIVPQQTFVEAVYGDFA